MLYEATEDEYDAIGELGPYDHFFSDEQRMFLSSFETPHAIEVFRRIYMHDWLADLREKEKGL